MSFGGPFDAFKPMMDFQFGSLQPRHEPRRYMPANSSAAPLVEALKIVEAYLYATAPDSNELQIVRLALKSHKQNG